MKDNDVIITEYPSGFKSVIMPMKGFRTVATDVHFGAGSANESEKQWGLSHYLEHCFFANDQKADKIGTYGAESNAFTDYEETVYQAFGPGSSVEQQNQYIADMVFKNEMTQDYIDGEKKIVSQEISEYDYENKSDAEELMWSMFYKGTSYEHDIIGTKKHVFGFTMEDLKNYKKEHYTVDNMILAIAGDITREKANEIIARYWLPNIPKEITPRQKVAPIAFNPKASYRYVVNKEMTQHNVAIAMPMPKVLGVYDYSLLIMKDILSRRLFDSVREKNKLVYGIGAGLRSTRIASSLNIGFKTTPENTDKVFNAVAEQIKRIQDGEITEKELEIVRNQEIYTRSEQYENVNENCDSTVLEFSNKGTVLSVDEKIKRIGQVSVDQVKVAAKKYINPTNPTVAVIGPKLKGAKTPGANFAKEFILE